MDQKGTKNGFKVFWFYCLGRWSCSQTEMNNTVGRTVLEGRLKVGFKQVETEMCVSRV